MTNRCGPRGRSWRYICCRARGSVNDPNLRTPRVSDTVTSLCGALQKGTYGKRLNASLINSATKSRESCRAACVGVTPVTCPCPRYLAQRFESPSHVSWSEQNDSQRSIRQDKYWHHPCRASNKRHRVEPLAAHQRPRRPNVKQRCVYHAFMEQPALFLSRVHQLLPFRRECWELTGHPPDDQNTHTRTHTGA